MTADYAALEARVAELEQQIRHILPAKMDAMNFGISVLHDEARAFREETESRFDRVEAALGRHGEQLDSLSTRMDRHGEQLDSLSTRMDRHGELLQEILRRLPGGAGQ
jgi:chromosome segregation ATPase